MLYFAYGSNLNKVQMKKRCPDSVPIIKVKLKGYKLVFNTAADIIESADGVVYGAVYKVSDKDIKNLDIYEGYPRLYRKINVKAEDENGKIYEAFAYVMNKKGKGKPSDMYYSIIKKGFKDWNLPLESLKEAKLKSFK
ncbi:Uncharacterized conserved protein YtfP, gamma-glutamylcyclotransferase (GGCT)/AIG2-like family [Clostridium sp. USBA 49]|uniref:gamma-glutamylcyclotransferase family protein n=1 Tax=Clostridium sp. USBA 49 TaxID=1881060 RepID=UPI00099915E4|nr:gamma-glutamylcyclotransferase family protein [Clostridium sp. USBA 49]SKA84880.1 Uncharacterized conserved protein YtfP, gamma-glutamylcyclotransferase (GGCT)/AIG2-like family [Clostridium sp. USBA 49]